MPTHGLHTSAEVASMISSGKVLLLAGDEALLSALPAGKWIGGTSANFMGEEGGITSKDRIFVTDISDIVDKVEIRTYDVASLKSIGKNYPENGFTALIVPGMSEIHGLFAKDVQGYDGVFNAPLAGWVSGVHVSEIGKTAPKAFAGSGKALSNEAAVMHVSLPKGLTARLDIINLFTQPTTGDVLTFDQDGFSTEGSCFVNGQKQSLAAYIADKKIDTKLPLVANYNGAMVNVSIQSVDPASGKVSFYAPVFKGIEYRFATPVPDYISAFSKAAGGSLGSVAFSCNCILNYLYAELEGKKTGALLGPITFGEVAYMLLNQTLVYLSIEKAG